MEPTPEPVEAAERPCAEEDGKQLEAFSRQPADDGLCYDTDEEEAHCDAFAAKSDKGDGEGDGGVAEPRSEPKALRATAETEVEEACAAPDAPAGGLGDETERRGRRAEEAEGEEDGARGENGFEAQAHDEEEGDGRLEETHEEDARDALPPSPVDLLKDDEEERRGEPREGAPSSRRAGKASEKQKRVSDAEKKTEEIFAACPEALVEELADGSKLRSALQRPVLGVLVGDTYSIKVTNEDAAFIIGKGGSTKKKIAGVSGCRVELEDNGLRLDVTGTEEQRERALLYIRLIMQQRLGPVRWDTERNDLCMDGVARLFRRAEDEEDVEGAKKSPRKDLTVLAVPSEAVAYVTGSNGQVLRRIEDEWRTLMFFTQQERGAGKHPGAGGSTPGDGGASQRRRRSAEEQPAPEEDYGGDREADAEAEEPQREATGGQQDQQDEGATMEEEEEDLARGDREVAADGAEKIQSTEGEKKPHDEADAAVPGGKMEELLIFGSERSRVGASLKVMSAVDQKLRGFYTRRLTAALALRERTRDGAEETRNSPTAKDAEAVAAEPTREAEGAKTGEGEQRVSEKVEGDAEGTTAHILLTTTLANICAADQSFWDVLRGVGPDAGSGSGTEDSQILIDILKIEDRHFSYCLGREGKTRRKLASAAGCILEYIGHFAFAAGASVERRRVQEYLSWLMKQREKPIFLSDICKEGETRPDLTVLDVPREKTSLVTGRQGNALREVEERTGTFCFFEGRRSGRPGAFAGSSGLDSRKRERLFIFGTFGEGRHQAANLLRRLMGLAPASFGDRGGSERDRGRRGDLRFPPFPAALLQEGGSYPPSSVFPFFPPRGEGLLAPGALSRRDMMPPFVDAPRILHGPHNSGARGMRGFFPPSRQVTLLGGGRKAPALPGMPGDAAEDAHLALMSGRGGDARHALAGVSGGGAGLLYAPPPFACGSRAFPGLAGEELERGGGGSHAGSYREASSARRGERERRERGSGGDSASPERVVMRRSPLASARYAPYYAPAMLRSWPRYDEGDETFAYNEESERRRGRGEYATAREEDVGATVYGRRGVSSSGCRASASSASCLPMVLPPPSFGGGVPLGEYAYPGGVEACRYGSPGGRRGERWARDEHGGRGEEAARAAAYLADREAEDEDRRDGRGRKPSGEGLYAGGGVWAPRQRVYGGRDERDVGDVYAAAADDRYLRGDEDRERREAYYYESRSGRGHAGDAQAGGRRRDGAGGAGGERHRQAAGGEDVKRRHDEEEGRRRDEAGTRRKDESDRRRRRDIDEREFFMAAAAQAGGAGGGGGDRVAAGRRLYEAEEEAEFPRGHKPYRHYRDGEEDRLRAQGGGAERREDEERAAKRRAALLAEEEHSAPRAGRRGGGPLSSYGGAAEGASDAGDQESGERRRDADSCHHHHGYDAAESEESYALLARDPQAARAHRGRATLERDVHAVDAGGHGRRRHEDRDFYPGGGERIRDKERGEDAYMAQLASRERLVRRGRGGGDDGRAMDAPPPAGGYGGPEDACRAGGGVEDDAPRRRRKSRSRSPGGAGYFVGYGGYAASRSHFPAQTAQHPHSHAEGARRRGCGGDGDEEVVAGGNEARDDLSRRTEEDRYRANAAAGRRRPEYASRAPGEEDRPRREEAGAAFGGEQRHRGYRTAREEHA